MPTQRGRVLRRPTNPEIAVFVSGVVSMGLEILAGRIVAPQYGSSIYTWGGVIAVSLAALSLGYHVGGKRAAERASYGRLSWLLLATAAYAGALAFAHEPILATTAGVPLPTRFESLPAVTLLFGVPTYLLGFVSPYAAELTRKSEVGAASGHVYAVGTIGSIAGAFGTTFLLVPGLSVERIALAFAGVLVAGAIGLARPTPSWKPWGARFLRGADRDPSTRASGVVPNRVVPSWAVPSRIAPRRPTGAELAVFTSGLVAMGLEIVAGRVVGTQFGSSIYTWGSIIGVSMAALSLGYHVGGKRAAERATDARLARLLLGATAYVAVLIFAREPLLGATTAFPLPARFASIPAVALLFGPPTYLLGAVNPYGAELSRIDGIGAASGHVYALSTVGSIAGAFAATYVLLPSLSVEGIGLLFGVALLATVVAILASESAPERRPTVTSVLVALLLVSSFAAPSLGYSIHGEVVHQTQTPYQELEVVDRGDTRTLYLDGKRHSAMDLDDPDRHVFEYTRYFHMPYLFADDPDEIDRVLFVGGGGFTGPKRFADEYDATVDVAEVDPEVIDAAENYFGLDEYRESGAVNVYNVGGRQHLQETDRTYDLIVMDAFKQDKVPFQLTTVEFMELASDRLSDDGMLYANVISARSGPASQFYRSEYRTMGEVFPQLYSFPTDDANVVQNVEVVATKNATRVSESELRERNRRRDIGIDLDDEIGSYQRSVPTDDVPILRDDRAPVDSLLEPMAGQRYVVEETDESDDATAAGAITRPPTAPAAAAG